MKDVSTCPSLSTLEIENTQLKEELTAVRIKNDSLRDENVSIKARFQELYKSKAGSNSSVSSGATIPVKPKAVASGLYAMTPKCSTRTVIIDPYRIKGKLSTSPRVLAYLHNWNVTLLQTLDHPVHDLDRFFDQVQFVVNLDFV
nr:hypothetical protein [Tanacetum cinerariifolium]